jgi:DNA-binding MltR family transcriptional regulator
MKMYEVDVLFSVTEYVQSELERENDRGAVILGVSMIDEMLRRVLETYFIADGKSAHELLSPDVAYAPLSSFGAKISLAFCLGLISSEERHDMRILKNIRNLFAHELSLLVLQHPPIAKQIAKLKLVEDTEDPPSSEEEKFYTTMYSLMASLFIRQLAIYGKRQGRIEEMEIIRRNETHS